MVKRVIGTRHSIKKPKVAGDSMSKEYEGITVQGVELARQSAKNLVAEIEETPENSVFFLGGVSEEIRTRSTARVYGAEMKKLLADNSKYVVVTEEDLAKGGNASYRSMVGHLKSIVDANPNKRVVVDVPLFLKEFSMRKHGWAEKATGAHTAYTLKLMEKVGGNEEAAFKYWIEHQGEQVDGLAGPKPVEVAKDYMKGLGRLESFVSRYIPNRPLVTGFVSHSWDADTFLMYVAGDGAVDLATFDKIRAGNGAIRETEVGAVKIDNGAATVTYRGHKHERKLEKIVAAIAAVSIIGSLLTLSGMTGNAIGLSQNNLMGMMFLVLFVTATLAYVAITRIRG
jgi:hypothetical protein